MKFFNGLGWHYVFWVLTYVNHFGFFGIILSRSMRENSVILKISPFWYTSLSNSCIWSFCHFCPMHNFLLWLIWKIQLFLAILEKSLPENHGSINFILSFWNPLYYRISKTDNKMHVHFLTYSESILVFLREKIVNISR